MTEKTPSDLKNCWFAAKYPNNFGRQVNEILDELNIEHFLPISKNVVERNGKSIVSFRPLGLNLIFIHTDLHTALSLSKDCRLPMSYTFDNRTKSLLIVPDKKMHDLMFLLNFSSNPLLLSNEQVRRGDRVKVTAGELAGIEGELVRIKGHKRVVVRLDELFSMATTYIPGAYLEKIED